MLEIRYTLLGEGSSDRALIPILNWLFGQRLPGGIVQGSWADLGRLRVPPRTLPERIDASVRLYPCDVLFVHRDADREGYVARVQEVREATTGRELPPVVPVVPVRMLETWLLFDESALRRAAGNPNGREPLDLPRTDQLDGLPDPKAVLRELLLTASGLSGRRRRTLQVSAGRVSSLVEDFGALRQLGAFQALESDLARLITDHGWSRPE